MTLPGAAVAVRGLSARYGRREVFHDVAFDLRPGQAVGVVGENGAGKTTLLRILVGLIRPAAGEVRIAGLAPRDAVCRVTTAYFAGEATLPGRVRGRDWGALAGYPAAGDARRLRRLSRGNRQLVGLRTAQAPSAALVVLDEPWEGLDPDGARWLSGLLVAKRDRGAAIVVSSHRLHDLSGVCDAYLFVVNHAATFIRGFELSPIGPVSAERLAETFDQLRAGQTWRPGQR